MAYYVAYLPMIDEEKNQKFRPQHVEHLKSYKKEGKIYKGGIFTDGSGGMIIYEAETYEEAMQIAKNDPYVKEKARDLDLREWEIRI